MYISRIVVRNFRNFAHFDIRIESGITCIIGENNAGKTNLLHAIRLAIDANLSSQYRQLIEQDIHCGINIRNPQQVIISLEFTDYSNNENECALVGAWEVEPDVARLTYRFRPKQLILDKIEEGAIPDNLTLEDYHWEITGGGCNDPATVEWNQELGHSIKFSDLQQFQVVFLQALRDVQQDLRQSRISPLGRLLDTEDIPEEEKEDLVEILRDANNSIAQKETICQAGVAIQKAFSVTAGDAFDMQIRLGMADPSFASVARSLTLLLSNDALSDFEIARNGLGLNNILYISMLIEYFERRVKNPNTAGQLLLIEEPEAHLHPQLQRVLFNSLSNKPFQTFITTHSTHITSHAPLKSMVALTKKDKPAICCTVLSKTAGLTSEEIGDLERYLDATRSTLLFARKVILVEGPAELFLIPPLLKKVLGIDLDSLGISLVPIHGVHFDVYAKLFKSLALPKKCAIIADGDLEPSDSTPSEEPLVPPNLEDLICDSVNVFLCDTTFEKALTITGMLPVLEKTAQELGAPVISQIINDAYKTMKSKKLNQSEQRKELRPIGQMVLNTSKRFGKARFAQIASKYVDLATDIPDYIHNGINWLIKK